MNVFVIGTGRCGSVTFSKACQHIANYTSGHETHAGILTDERLKYSDAHVEVDPHLAWTLGLILNRYPNAFYVHLQRRRDEVLQSWFRRGIHPNRGAAPLIDVMFQTNSARLSPHQYRDSLALLYDTVTANVANGLTQVRSMDVWLHEAKESFPAFWRAIDAEGDLESARCEFDKHYNQSS